MAKLYCNIFKDRKSQGEKEGGGVQMYLRLNRAGDDT